MPSYSTSINSVETLNKKPLIRVTGALNGVLKYNEKRLTFVENKNNDTGNFVSVPLIKTPRMIYPHFKVNVGRWGDVYEGSPYTPINGFIGKHTSSDWEFATDSGFSNIVVARYNDTHNLTKFTSFGLVANTTYYVRTRYINDDFGIASDFSPAIEITTAP